MKKLIESRGFKLISLVSVVTALIGWILIPQANGWLLVLALFPWVIRSITGKMPFRRSSFDLPLSLFLLTAGVGVWAAYDQNLAFRKFFIILGAILIYYAIIDQSKDNLFFIINGLGVYGLIITAMFLLKHDWSSFPADVKILNSIGQWWMQIRPEISFEKLSDVNIVTANIAGGVDAFLLPLCVASFIHFKQQKKILSAVFISTIIGLLFVSLLLSSSRAAWAATVVGIGLFGILNLSKTQRFFATNQKLLLILPILIMIGGIVVPIFGGFNRPALESPFNDESSFSSRLEIAKNTLYLIADYPFTGGGLSSFPGLYSQYMLVIPFFVFSYSHNLFLDITLEQGIFGLIFLGWIIFKCSKNSLSIDNKEKIAESKSKLLATAIYSSLIIVLLHGIADDPIYSSFWGLPLLFTLPGLSEANTSHHPETLQEILKSPKFGALGLAIVFILIVIFYKPIFAKWHANIGAVLMSKVELKNWPDNEWLFWQDIKVFESSRNQFEKAISLDPNQRTANHRLGLIEMASRDFPNARDYLETSNKVAPAHRGIKKSLGYCYIWLGEFEKADFYVMQIPEAREEIQTYSWWWQTKNRGDLAEKASAYLFIRSSLGTQP